MLFNSYYFIFIFLPVTVTVFFLLGHKGKNQWAMAWLILASFIFYGWHHPMLIWLIGASILFNFFWGIWVSRHSKVLLASGITVNLGFLGYFKYSAFFSDNLFTLTNIRMELPEMMFPLAISFFTFQQIAYLVDAYRGKIAEHHFLNYCLFVTFFPRLTQGPIVYHQELMPQFKQRKIFRWDPERIAVGTTVFFFGLFKKVFVADGLAAYASPVYEAARYAYPLSCLEAWEGALAYTLQIYFDFSGYSDMAIGLAYLFGIRIPLNFNSPYKSLNIIDFWRRWHISLSRFLRDYLYVPMGGNRKGEGRRFVNLMITMLLGGLWHGAAWTFVIWGGLHGVFLIINHSWEKLKQKLGWQGKSGPFARLLSVLTTFICVTVAWVFFRSDSASTAFHMIGCMAAKNGFSLPEKYLDKFGVAAQQLQKWGVDFHEMKYFEGSNEVVHILIALLIVWFAPNVQQMMDRYVPYLNIMAKGERLSKPPFWFIWRPSFFWAIILVITTLTATLLLSRASEFLYFKF